MALSWMRFPVHADQPMIVEVAAGNFLEPLDQEMWALSRNVLNNFITIRRGLDNIAPP